MSASKSFWKTLPATSFLGFLLGVFFLFITAAFANDIIEMGRQPPLRYALSLLISGLFPVFYAASGFALGKRFWKALIPLFALHFVLMGFLAQRLPDRPQTAQMDAVEIARLSHRLSFDALAIMLAIAVGYGCFLYVTITQGKRFFRINAEIELATEIHHVLVPAIDTTIAGYEFYGRSLPSGEVGGDLIDVAGSESNWVAYVADVSGHGVAPGVVMGMVKSAARMLLSSGDSPAHLMARLNEVIFPLKKSNMFVTFCFLAHDGNKLLIGLAGHPPILHFSAAKNAVMQLQSPNLPLGVFPGGDFASFEIQAEQGDVFALYTDGFLEPENAAGEEFGLARLQAELQRHGRESLEVICKSLNEIVASHGVQLDDQSLLLVRKM